MLLRPAEKPDDAGTEFGVDAHGRPDAMPEIARRLCPDLVPAPQWNQHCFDQVWLFAPASDSWTLRQIAQQLLPGDSGHAGP